MLKLVNPKNTYNCPKKISIYEESTVDITESESVYKVERGQLKTDTGDYIVRWFITKNGLPEYQVNEFLMQKGLEKKKTSYSYAYSLIKLLRFLQKRNINYLDCTQFQARQYVRSLVNGDMDDLIIKNTTTKVTYSTISTDITVMTEFFKFLKDEQIEIKMELKYEKKAKKRAFLYGQIFEYNYGKIVDKNITNLKPSKKYLKWYEDNEIEAIRSNFTTLRDEVVFLMTLEGMRIDEVLSLKLDSMDDIEQTVQPTRSKRKIDDSNEIRIVSLPTSTYDLLNKYLFTERANAESESETFSDYIFINLRKGRNQGKELSYHNYLKILKDAAARAGLDRKKIRTHSGRSTKVNELLEHQVLYPEDNITDEIIREIMGWSSPDSIEPYKNRGNRVIAKSAAQKVYRRREERKSSLTKEEISKKNKELIDTSKKLHRERGSIVGV